MLSASVAIQTTTQAVVFVAAAAALCPPGISCVLTRFRRARTFRQIDASQIGDEQQIEQDVGAFVAQGLSPAGSPGKASISGSSFHWVSSSSSRQPPDWGRQ